MPPQLAILICILVVLYLFWMDRKRIESVSGAIWIPFIWMFLAGSRYVSQWFNLGVPTDPMDVYIEGSPVDRAFFFVLIAGGLIVLLQRKLNWGELFRKNPWIWLFIFYCGISIVWSDSPFVSFKRWIKALGAMIMVLVILTEDHPYKALGVMLRRLAFMLLPLSVLLIKYYPELGRAYHMGKPMFTGVAGQKNGLGQICLISGIYFSWHILLGRWRRFDLERLHYSIYFIILPMIAWLFYMANSATSLGCMIAVAFLLIISQLPAINRKPRRLVTIVILMISLLGFAELTLGISNLIIAGLGRDSNLTTRVSMWEHLLKMDINPVIGVGFESFWSGERLKDIWEEWQGVIQSHNGYIDLYLNLGVIGLVLFGISVIYGSIKVIKDLQSEYSFAVLRISFILAFVLYNWTEATIKPISNMFLLLTVGILSTPRSIKSKKRAATDLNYNIDGIL